MFPSRDQRKFTQFDAGGEIEIEKVPSQEVEIRRKDLLPVFDHFHSIKSNWNDGSFVGGHYQGTSSSEPHQAKDKYQQETVSCHSKPSSLVSVESLDRGSSQTTKSLLDLDPVNTVKPREYVDQTMDKIGNARSGYTLASPLMSSTFSNRGSVSSKVNFDKLDFLVEESCVTNDLSSLKCNTASMRRPTAEGNHSSNTSGSCEISNTSSDQFSSSSNVPPGGAATIGLRAQSGFGLYFQEGYCKASELDECHELTGLQPL